MPHRVTLDRPDDFDGWRDAARALALANVHPAEVSWGVAGDAGDLFAGAASLPPAAPDRQLSVPKPFLDLAHQVVLHSDPERFALLYEQLIALSDKRASMDDRADPRLDRLQTIAKAVRRDSHKMHAFVRFREVEEDGRTRFVAFFEPEHHIVRANAGFFVRRFASLNWSILTPEVSIHWDGESVREGPGATRADAPDGDPVEELWKSYYASIFNPARLKVGAMLSEMPKKYWANMPETALVPAMIAGAQQREAAMIEAGARQPPAPPPHASPPDAPLDEVRTARGGSNAEAALAALREEASQCRRCHLWEPATQTVFGQGPADASLVLVGEQPGDQEDLAGLPFVGPAGQMLDAALVEAGIDRATTYVTNAVKHFKFEPRGKRRIHQTPDASEIEACRWWQEQERAIISPKVTVALGGSAGRALTGKAVTIGRMRGRPHPLDGGGELWITVHPSYLLRLPDADRKAAEREKFVADLTLVRERLAALG